MEKLGDICVRSVKGRVVAYWCSLDGSRDVFLCAIEQSTFNNHVHVRDLFAELAQEVFMNRAREKGDSICLRAREPLARTVQFPID